MVVMSNHTKRLPTAVLKIAGVAGAEEEEEEGVATGAPKQL
jgi:hypothetical protein